MQKLNIKIEKALKENPITVENGKIVPHLFERFPGFDGGDVPKDYIVYAEMPELPGAMHGLSYYKYEFTIYSGSNIFKIQKQLRSALKNVTTEFDKFTEIVAENRYGVCDPTLGVHVRTLVFGILDEDDVDEQLEEGH